MKYTVKVIAFGITFLDGKPVTVPQPLGTRILAMLGPEVVFAVPLESDGECEFTFWSVNTDGDIEFPDELQRRGEGGEFAYLTSSSIGGNHRADFHFFYTMKVTRREVRHL